MHEGVAEVVDVLDGGEAGGDGGGTEETGGGTPDNGTSGGYAAPVSVWDYFTALDRDHCAPSDEVHDRAYEIVSCTWSETPETDDGARQVSILAIHGSAPSMVSRIGLLCLSGFVGYRLTLTVRQTIGNQAPAGSNENVRRRNGQRPTLRKQLQDACAVSCFGSP